jgi:NAD(P)-dependent dehydrogenase (short-subunit alcohol dehydrogenase family)
VKADVSDDAVTDAVSGTITRLGGLDILVNSAGIMARGTVEKVDLDAWRRVLEVNVLGTARVARAALPALRASAAAGGHPAIVNMCSVWALAGSPGSVAYASSKGAIASLTMAMAADHVREGIRVNCVAAGPVDTPWVRRELDAAPDPAAALAHVHSRQPNGRLITAEEIAASVCHLASDLAGATTGTSMVVDGGVLAIRLPA